jgi:hypothetical protein
LQLLVDGLGNGDVSQVHQLPDGTTIIINMQEDNGGSAVATRTKQQKKPSIVGKTKPQAMTRAMTRAMALAAAVGIPRVRMAKRTIASRGPMLYPQIGSTAW